VDFTIADFVADLRAPTPSAAAELASPNGPELLQHSRRLGALLRELMLQQLLDFASRIKQIRKRLRLLHPSRRLDQQQQKLDEWERRLHHASGLALGRRQSRLGVLEHRLTRNSPVAPLLRLSARAAQLQQRLLAAFRESQQYRGQQLALAAQRLDSVSPLGTLQRGYAIVRDPAGRAVRRSADTASGDRLEIRLAQGELEVVVASKR
jgi:exodeoxyribonuclease VII large subunit